MDGKLRNMTSVYLTGERGILCLYRIGSRVANHKYIGSAGGHFEKEELNDAKRCALREMQEELNLTEADIEDLKLRYITLRLKDGEKAPRGSSNGSPMRKQSELKCPCLPSICCFII